MPDAATGYAFELPGINPAVRSRPYRYAYGACCARPSNAWNALCKLDLDRGTALTWHEPGGVAWEPLFAARPGGVALTWHEPGWGGGQRDRDAVAARALGGQGTTLLLL